MKMRTIGIATSTLLCTALLSFSWSEQRGVSLSIQSAQARVGRPLTPVSVAGVARRHNRRAAYGYGGYGYGAAVAGAAAVASSLPMVDGVATPGATLTRRKLILTMGSHSTHTGPITE